MKERIFHLRHDLDPAGNIRRLHAYIRSINPAFKPVPKLQAAANKRANLRRVK
jgi:hypothetical protein